MHQLRTAIPINHLTIPYRYYRIIYAVNKYYKTYTNLQVHVKLIKLNYAIEPQPFQAPATPNRLNISWGIIIVYSKLVFEIKCKQNQLNIYINSIYRVWFSFYAKLYLKNIYILEDFIYICMLHVTKDGSIYMLFKAWYIKCIYLQV